MERNAIEKKDYTVNGGLGASNQRRQVYTTEAF